MEIVKKAAAQLAECAEIMLASVSESGYPRICVMSRAKSDGIKKIWCTTGLGGTKVRHFKSNPKAGVCFWSGHNSVTLTGKAAVLTDRAIRAEMWHDWYAEHFPGGIDDPSYCVIEFTTEEATMWIDGEFVTVGSGALG